MIAKNLSVLRRRKGWPQKRTAYNLDLKLSTYQAYEEDRAEPKIKTIIRMADLYGVTIDKLLREEIKTTIQ
jgi:transcriptional regulator with XRE-family HTH domain